MDSNYRSNPSKIENDGRVISSGNDLFNLVKGVNTDTNLNEYRTCNITRVMNMDEDLDLPVFLARQPVAQSR